MSGEMKKASGGFEYVKGKIQRWLGKTTGNRSMQAKGFGNQAKGGVKYEAGDIQGKVDKLKGRAAQDKSSGRDRSSQKDRSSRKNRT